MAPSLLISGQFEHSHWPRRQKQAAPRTALPQNTHLSTSSPPLTASERSLLVGCRATTTCRPTATTVSRPCQGSGSTAILRHTETWQRPSATFRNVHISPSSHLPRLCCSSRCSMYGLIREAADECIGALLLVAPPYKAIAAVTGSFISTLAQLWSWMTTSPLGYRRSWNMNAARWARLRY